MKQQVESQGEEKTRARGYRGRFPVMSRQENPRTIDSAERIALREIDTAGPSPDVKPSTRCGQRVYKVNTIRRARTRGGLFLGASRFLTLRLYRFGTARFKLTVYTGIIVCKGGRLCDLWN